jgi:hypothetical protein
VIVATVGAASMGRVVSTGKEASEASVAGSRFIGGAPGLSAPQALTTNAVVGQPGLQRGLPIGFGPLPRPNIFTRSVNPISGPNGAHAILTSAGFGQSLRR